MRVGDATFYLNFLAGVRENRERTEEALASLADGKRVRRASDDPVGAHETLGLRARLVRLGGFNRSAESARTALATLDGVLGEAFDLLNEVRTEAMAGASAPTGDANQIRAANIEGLRAQLLALANTSQGGRYLFGGTETAAPPFAADGTYNGNTAEVQAPIDSDEQVGATVDGSRVFTDPTNILVALDDLVQALRDNRTDDVGALVPVLGEALDRIAQVRGEVGTRMDRIDRRLVRHGDEGLALLQRIGSIEDADLAATAVALQSSETATSALSAAAARVLGRSLFDFLG